MNRRELLKAAAALPLSQSFAAPVRAQPAYPTRNLARRRVGRLRQSLRSDVALKTAFSAGKITTAGLRKENARAAPNHFIACKNFRASPNRA